ncbi:hypothetical protein [Nitrosomonas sp.]|uniref:hypothetical protein n=1 Tax=Nitrosomonas sp. TaxID=42353 RepID=UPI0025F300C7|nr:hypothetical protein [Nitrosomonas sp.]
MDRLDVSAVDGTEFVIGLSFSMRGDLSTSNPDAPTIGGGFVLAATRFCAGDSTGSSRTVYSRKMRPEDQFNSINNIKNGSLTACGEVNLMKGLPFALVSIETLKADKTDS